MKKTFDKITLVSNKLCYYVSFLCMAVAIILTILLTADVILRKVTSGVVSIKGCYEITQLLLSCFVFSSWGYTQSVHGHIHVVMFIQKMPQKLRFFCYGLTSLLSVAVMAFGAYALYFQIFAMKKTGEASANLMIPYWPFYIFEFVAFVLLTLVLLLDAIKGITAMWNKEMAEEVQADWV